VSASLGGKAFGGVKLDVSPRAHELTSTDRLPLPNLLDFAGVPTPVVEIVDVQRHAAEKLHAMARDYGSQENSRVRDLVDVVILIEHDELDARQVADAARNVWAERNNTAPPTEFPALPASWPARYEQLAVAHELSTETFDGATALIHKLWSDMFARKEP
jgi:hypothetical protein